MKAKEVWVLACSSRLRFINNVIDNFKRQTFEKKRLVIVENGESVSKFPDIGQDITLMSAKGVSTSKNIGLNYLKEKGNVFWTSFDEDDYYGPNYLEELVENSDKADIIGKTNSFIHFDEDKMYLLDFEYENCFTNMIFGYSISCWTKDCVNYPRLNGWGEDAAFVNLMKEKGAKVWATSRYNSLIKRYHNGNHTWIADKEEILNLYPERAYELDYDLDTINNLNEEYYILIDKKKLNVQETSSYKKIIEMSDKKNFLHNQLKKLGIR